MSVLQLILINLFAWLLIHLVVPYVVTLMPDGRFLPTKLLFRVRVWEAGGRAYETCCAVRRWKDIVPDGAAWFSKGFRKKHLRTADPEYLERFLRETCRGEMSHWIVLSCAALFFLWNSWRVGLIMIVYGLVANMPCIIIQRYNRSRLARLLTRIQISTRLEDQEESRPQASCP